MNWVAQAIAFVLLFLTATPAFAHTGTGLNGGFLAGFYHPLSGFDHMLAMVAVGLWGAFLGRPLIYALPVIFPFMMVVGAAIGITQVVLHGTEIGIALSVLILGLMIALAVRAPVWLACLIVALFAVCHGYAHGRELPSALDPIGYSLGFVLATGMLHILGIGIGSLSSTRIGTIAVRAMGGAIALIGVGFLYVAIVK